ncbi:MAG TPA: GAF domain-containing protein, partial [Actinomycetota bacterium]|nr:GAF domain-containing protein [Actinomycetota bacterium]
MRTTAERPRTTTSPQRRIAGLRDFKTPTLEAVERRRWQLWLLAGFVIFGLALSTTLLTVDNTVFTSLSFLPIYVIRVLFMGIAAAIGLYLVDKEYRLRKLTHDLVDERVLSAALTNRLKELSVLSEVGKAINQVLDIDDVLRMILRSAVEMLEADRGSVMLISEDGEELVLAHAQGFDGLDVEGSVVPLGVGIAGQVARDREPILVNGSAPTDLLTDDRHSEAVSSISVPFVSKDELHGVLNVSVVTHLREFSEYDLRAIGLFAEHAAIAIRNARAYEQEKQAIFRFEQADKLKSEFLATVSHELRTPLTSIIGCATTIRKRPHELSEAHKAEFLELIEQQAGRLLHMVEDLLSASMIESGGSALTRKPVDLVALALSIERAFEAAGSVGPIKVDAPERVIAYGDAMALEQVLTNLMDNAAKYSDRGSPIVLRVWEEPGDACFSVTDRGRGIAEDEIGQVFERFKQLD